MYYTIHQTSDIAVYSGGQFFILRDRNGLLHFYFNDLKYTILPTFILWGYSSSNIFKQQNVVYIEALKVAYFDISALYYINICIIFNLKN